MDGGDARQTTEGGGSGGVDMFQLALKGDNQQVMVRAKQDPGLIGKRDENGRSLLHWAASGGHKELVQWLLDHQAERDARDDARWTPLIIASSAGHEAVVRILLGAGADPDACTDQGRTSLLYAASRNRQAIVKMLIEEASHSVNLADKHGATPLHRAVGCGHVEVVKQLIGGANHLDLEAKDQPTRNTPLHLACEEGHVEIIKALLEAGADASALNKEEKTPLQLASPQVQRIFRNLQQQHQKQ